MTARVISEHDATLAVEAAAKGQYDRLCAQALEETGTVLPSWDEQSPHVKLEFRQGVLTVVWDALGALPDQRRTSWFEGYAAGSHDEQIESWTTENPYPEEA